MWLLQIDYRLSTRQETTDAYKYHRDSRQKLKPERVIGLPSLFPWIFPFSLFPIPGRRTLDMTLLCCSPKDFAELQSS